jgi:hypothetical protein
MREMRFGWAQVGTGCGTFHVRNEGWARTSGLKIAIIYMPNYQVTGARPAGRGLDPLAQQRRFALARSLHLRPDAVFPATPLDCLPLL